MIEYWIIPCNPKHFDVSAHFDTHDTVVWRNSFSIKVSDIAYIYLSAPYSEIRYRCRVISDIVDDTTLQENSYAVPSKTNNNYFSKKVKYIVLQLEKVYPTGAYPLSELREHGLGQVQIQARPDRKLREYIHNKEKELQEQGE